MSKHVAIRVALRNSLRAKELITMLNRHGECISYDDCLAIDAYWASDIVMNGNGYDVPLSITHARGEMRKTCKFLQELEVNEKIVALERSAHNTCVIIDLLGTVQRVSTINCVNFGNICIKLYNNT